MSRDRNVVRERHVYILRNARLDPEWAEVERQTLSIAQRAISSLIQTQGVGDLYRIYAAAQRDGIDFNLTYVPASFETPLKAPFDTVYMKELFEVGYRIRRERPEMGEDTAQFPVRPGHALCRRGAEMTSGAGATYAARRGGAG